MNEKEVIDAIFNDPTVKYELTEFQGLDKQIHEMLDIFSRPGTGKHVGKDVYYIRPLCRFHSEKTEFQVYVEGGKSNPEEIVRQLWVWKLINYYNYSPDQIRCEIPVQFGSAEPTKYADIAVYHNNDRETVKILFEVKKPNRKDGIEQLKSYLGAKGNPIGVWSNGANKLILYKPQNKDFDTLSEIPKVNEDEKDVMEVNRTLDTLKKQFNFKKIVQDLEELVLANSGNDEFNEIFKLIYAKIYDEKQAEEDARRKRIVYFKKYEDPNKTYETINRLYREACRKWPGVFEEPDIKLRQDHLQVCVGPIEDKRLLGSNLRIMDDAFEYLMPTEAKKKKGQFFTPRHVIEMCVRMLNPKDYEYVIDPACGSAGFLLHAMEWAMPANNPTEQELRKSRYAEKYLWGIDFEARAAKISRALMLIAGDGNSNIFGPDVSSIDPKTWYNTSSGRDLMQKLRSKPVLLKNSIPSSEILKDEEKAWDYFSEMHFDIVLANPPFAGELKDKKMLQHYELAAPALRRAKDKQPKEERDVIFIERIINLLRPGGRAAIVLPQGKFNNSSLTFIREFILHKARLLAVIGLHGNTFKPHTGTKTSVLVIQKYTEDELKKYKQVREKVLAECPDYQKEITTLIEGAGGVVDIDETQIPEEILSVLNEEFPDEDVESEENNEVSEAELIEQNSLEEKIEQANDNLMRLIKERDRSYEQLQELYGIVNALVQEQQNHLADLIADSTKNRQQRAAAKKDMQNEYKSKLKALKEHHKPIEKQIKADLKRFEKEIPLADYELKKLTIKGRLQIIKDTPDIIERLRNRFIDAEVAQKLDYDIFMAVSERGGKNNSGDYVFMHDDSGNLLDDTIGNPKIDQDLVNYDISREDLKNAAKKYRRFLSPSSECQYGMAAEPIPSYGSQFISDDKLCIAEAFVKFAVENDFDFWKEEE
ncbi:MAG: N-6 DNA methylase [Bacteroidales bacterium]|nr:N-6 DNA methylase [Bacteroidales bacterium]